MATVSSAAPPESSSRLGFGDSISTRYTDAYLAASAIIAFGTAAKVIGVVAAVILGLISLTSGGGWSQPGAVEM